MADETRTRRRKSLQAPAKKESMEGTSTCNLELDEHDVLDKKK